MYQFKAPIVIHRKPVAEQFLVASQQVHHHGADAEDGESEQPPIPVAHQEHNKGVPRMHQKYDGHQLLHGDGYLGFAFDGLLQSEFHRTNDAAFPRIFVIRRLYDDVHFPPAIGLKGNGLRHISRGVIAPAFRRLTRLMKQLPVYVNRGGTADTRNP
ncbi:hypothetical protein D1872_214860 [compost metagenome]